MFSDTPLTVVDVFPKAVLVRSPARAPFSIPRDQLPPDLEVGDVLVRTLGDRVARVGSELTEHARQILVAAAAVLAVELDIDQPTAQSLMAMWATHANLGRA